MKKCHIQSKRVSQTATGGALSVTLCFLMCLSAFGQSLGAVDTLYPVSPASSSAKTSQENTSAEESEQMEKTLGQMEKRVDTIEARLGKTSRPPSVTYNVDRRLSDLERRLQKIEQQLTRMQKWEQRIHRLEMK